MRPEDFPPEVHASLSELRQIAQRAKNAQDPGLRYATPMEIALSELLRHPSHCTGHSKRTGLACRGQAVIGGTLCIKHGAQYSHIKKARDQRLQQLAGPALREMVKMSKSRKDTLIKQRAAADILDRAGVGAIAEAKVRHSFHGNLSAGVTVQIGFLTTIAPPRIEAPHDPRRVDAIVEGTVAEEPVPNAEAPPAGDPRPAGGDDPA
jgi:hypothetical protein